MTSFFKSFLQKGLTLIFIITVLGKADAQMAVPIPFPLPGENFSLSRFAVYTFSKEDGADFKILSSFPFKPLPAFNAARPVPIADTVESGWIYFIIKNNLAVDTALIIKTHSQANRIILYEQRDQFLEEVGRSGTAMPFSQLSEKDPRRIKVQLHANAVQHFYLRQQRHGLSSRLETPDLQTETQAIVEKYKADLYISPLKLFTLLLLGLHLAAFLFGIVKYYNPHKDKAYFWYALCNFLTFVFISADGNFLVLDTFLWNNLNQVDYFFLFNVAAILSLLQFQVEMLQLKVFRPKLVTAIKVFSMVLAGAALLTLVVDQLRIFPSVFYISRALTHSFVVFIIIFFFYLRKRRTGFNKYMYYGMVCWIIGFSFYIPYIWFDLKRHLPPLIRGNFIMGVSTFVEMVFFLKALDYRDQETERDKIRFQQQLIEQLERNKVLQQTFTEDLETQVKDRTTELLEQRKKMEQQREETLRVEFERRFSESELKALRSQINPHFIFNVLNTIESFALENNPDAASAMIQKFSRLTRLVLENSLYQVVPIENDLEALTLYIELEQIRYAGKFLADVQVDQEVLEGSYSIPPMIIQPYVENAILHGLRNLPGVGTLRIQVSRQDYYVIIIIEDNGIGRARSSALKKNEVIKRTSIGMSVTQDRISIFNNLAQHSKASVEICDLEKGTKVELKFPVEHV